MTEPRKQSAPHSPRLKEIVDVAARSGRVKLNLFIQDQDWVAIEGDRASLEFFGNLLLEFTKDDGPDFVNLDSPGLFFKIGSEGITLYRKP